MRESYRLRQAMEGILRGLQQELGWRGIGTGAGPGCWPIWPGLVADGLMERPPERLKLGFYPCRGRRIAGKLSLDLRPLLPVQVEAA